MTGASSDRNAGRKSTRGGARKVTVAALAVLCAVGAADLTLGILPDGFSLREDQYAAAVPADPADDQSVGAGAFAVETFEQALSVHYLRRAEQVEAASARFTADGAKGYVQALDSILSQQVALDTETFMTARALGDPAVSRGRTVAGQNFWLVEFPVEIGYIKPDRTLSSAMKARIVVVEKPGRFATSRSGGYAAASLIVSSSR